MPCFIRPREEKPSQPNPFLQVLGHVGPSAVVFTIMMIAMPAIFQPPIAYPIAFVSGVIPLL